MAQFLKFKYVLLVVLITYFSVAAMLHQGFPPSHDGEYHVVRFYEFDKTLRDGNIFPRWAADLNQGFGVPLFNYVYPFPNYMASFFHLLGFSFIDAFKLSMFFAAMIGGIFFYLWSKEFWGNLGGVVSSIFYAFSPYHFVDVYIRGSIGEVWALAFFPAFLWSVTKLFKTKDKKFITISGVFLAIIVYSHNILALMFFMFAISYMIYFSLFVYKNENKQCLINLFLVIAIGLSVSAAFWLPALLEKSYVQGLQIFNIKETFPEVYQFIFPSWGSGFADSSLNTQMSFQIGVANLMVVAASILILFISIRRKSNDAKVIGFFLSWFIFVFFLMNKFSLFIWDSVPLMNYFQFPWRFLSIEILMASFLAGNILKIWPSKIIALLMILLVFGLGIGYAKPAYYHNRQDDYYVKRPNFIEGTNSPADFFNTIWMNRYLKKRNEKIIFTKGSGKVEFGAMKSTSYSFNILARENSEIMISTAYFPGWTSFIDDKQVNIKPDTDGLITFYVPKGKHNINLRFMNTNVRRIAEAWSLFAILLIVTVFVKSSYARIKR